MLHCDSKQGNSCEGSVVIVLCIVQFVEFCIEFTVNIQHVQDVEDVQFVQCIRCVQYAQYAQYAQHNLPYTAPISLLFSNQLILLQITDKTDRQTSVPSAAQPTDCVDNASGSVLPVAKWKWYLHAF